VTGPAGDLEAKVVDLISRSAVRVPPYPAVAMRLQKLVASGRFGVTDIVRIAREDQAVAAMLLRSANSAHYRGVTQIGSINDAISRIGAVEVCRIALAVGLGGVAGASGPLAELRRRSWREALLGAHVAERLAERRKIPTDQAFVSGLLHAFGRLVAVATFEEVLATSGDERILPAAAWESSISLFEEELGIVTAARWSLPPALCAVIASYQHPERAGVHKPMVELVLLADRVARMAETNSFPQPGELAKLPGINADEVALVTQLLGQLPAVLAAMEEGGAMAAAPAAAASKRSQIAPPDKSALEGDLKPASFGVELVRAGGAVTCEAQYLATNGVAFTSDGKVRENTLIRLKVDSGADGWLEVWANAVQCRTEGTAQLVEAKLFGAAQGIQRSWEKLYSSL
jgi:HD-like signal output (HDOD) protein